VDISVVIPAFNEANKMDFDVKSAASFFSEACLRGEIIVVDDGSTDGTAAAALGVPIPSSVKRKVIRLDTNSGKGFAVRAGVLDSEGEVVLFADSGTCIPYSDAVSYIDRIRAGNLDMALASRRLEETFIIQNRPLKRRILSWFFHQAAVWIVGLPRWITDSQCGFKLYRGEIARQLFGELITTGYMFELEILLRALQRGCRIEEFPVRWTCDLDTRMRPASDAAGVWRELLQVRKIAKKKRMGT
jgi:dolichyl-phosphate beta-glucosyltransferase